MIKFLYHTKDKPSEIVEVARSFSRKLNLGNYETCDFFCSMKAECLENEADMIGQKLVNRCVAQVERDIEEFKEKQKPTDK